MEQLINQFLHIYFWVFLVALIVGVIKIANEGIEETTNGVSFWALVAWTVWIMSFKY